jgi:hypothetical protein
LPKVARVAVAPVGVAVQLGVAQQPAAEPVVVALQPAVELAVAAAVRLFAYQ